jgi:hypothetical protein
VQKNAPIPCHEGDIMKVITATIVDATHLEVSQPLTAPPGTTIQIVIPEEGEDDRAWRDAARQHFLDAYDEQDAIYDNL